MDHINSASPSKNESPPLAAYELQDVIENIQDIQRRIAILNDARACLRSQIDQLNSALEDDTFIPDILSGSLSDCLTKIPPLQKEILEKYEALRLGAMPAHISSAAENLEKQEKLIAQRAVYLDAVHFFMGLHGEDPATQDCLDQHKKRLALYDYAQIPPEDWEQTLGKYVLLKKAMEEPDPKTKFSILMQMNSLFELQIIYDININGIHFAAGTREPDAPSPTASEPESDAQVSTAAQPQSTKSEQVIQIPQTRKPDDASPGSPVPEGDSQNISASEPTPAAHTSDAPGSQPRSALSQTSDEISCESTLSGKDSEFPYDKSSECPSDKDILISSDRVSEFSSAEDEETLSGQEIQGTSNEAGNAAVSWESLGIENVDSLTVHIDDSKLTRYESDKTKKFGVKDFKNDLSKIGIPRAAITLGSAKKYSGVTPDLLMSICGGKRSIYALTCDKLVQLGYLRKYTLLGHGQFFVLSSKGVKVFKSKDAARSLGFRQSFDNDEFQPIEDSTNSAMARIMMFHSFTFPKTMDPDYKFASLSTYLGTDGYILRVPHVFPEKLEVGFIGLITQSPEEFDSLKTAFEDTVEKLDIVAVTGVNLEHAKALSGWLYTVFSDKLSGKRLWYVDYETDTFYNYEDDSVISFTEPDPPDGNHQNGVSDGDDSGNSSDNPDSSDPGTLSGTTDAVTNAETSADQAIVSAHQSLADKTAVPAHQTSTDQTTVPTHQTSADQAAVPAHQSLADKTTVPAHQSLADKASVPAHQSLADQATVPAHQVLADQASVSAHQTPADQAAVPTHQVSADTAADSHPTEPNPAVPLPAASTAAASSAPSQPSVSSPAPKSLSDSDRIHFRETVQEMLAAGRFCCAAAYLKFLAGKYQEFVSPYTQLAYALNDPLGECSYSSMRIFQIYYAGNEVPNDYYVLSAVLRNYFLDHSSYDYMLQQLQGSISSISLLEDNPSLNQVIYALQSFKSSHNRGMDFYADYRQKKREAFEKYLASVRSEAAELYDNNTGGIIKENASHRRVLETKKLIFAKDSDLMVCLEAVKEDNREFLSIIRDLLISGYIKDGADITADNIDSSKIDHVLDANWELAANNMRLVKRSSDLMSSLRMNLFKLVKKVVVVLCGYVSALDGSSIDENDPGFIHYKRIRNTLLENIREAVSFFKKRPASSQADLAGQSVLCAALKELASRLDGSYDEDSSLYFYLDFLKNDKVLLDSDYLPVLDDVNEIPQLSVLSRIEDHFASPEKSLESRLTDIFNGGDDYGSASLILRYLQKYPESVNNKELLNSSIENAVLYPRKDMENKRRGFIEDLELAQSYGQIDNTTEDRKEALIQIMDSWYDWAMDTDNYGFFYKILESIRRKIKEDAQVRAVDLMASLSVYQKENPGWQDSELVSDAVSQIRSRIQSQNYAAAEDLLNRLIADDLDSDTDFIQHDYLDEFLREYTLNSSQAGTARSTLQSRLLKGHNKDSRGAARLIENWPKGSNTSSSTIKNLLLALGFAVEEVSVHAPIQGKDHYQVTLRRPVNGRKSNYKHPISVFGSEAEEKGFRVVNIFGKMDAGRLIDVFKEIGTAKNTMILLDHTLTLPDRRELARKTKTEFSTRTFLVIDRVVLVYLANHYSETAVNRMLMAVTIPFAACQPYVSDSARIMPPEIFMGRKNELEKIESSSGVNIVYGGRQLGKSALLRMAQKDINMDENGDRAILVDLKGLDYKAAAKRISGALYDEGILKTEHITEDWDELSRDIKNRLRDSSGPDYIPYLLLLMDEADVFIESCETVGYRPFDSLKDIQGVGSGRFKFVVAGLRNVIRFKKNIALSNNSVLTHLSSLTITPFKSTEARELLEVPLSYLGFRFPDDNKTQMLISTIFGTTNYFPGLLQLYCAKLVEAMGRDYAGYSETETPPYIVREEHIKKALSDKTLEEQIREKFFITLKYGDDDYYYLIALLTAFNYHNNKTQNGCSAQDIISIASSYEVTRISSLSCEKVAALMEEMRELNVLQYVGDERYRFARHSFCQMMGSIQEIDDEILEYAIDQGD